ncbi:uncharacterized protein [Fopius arisanus]|uniref:MULE transposase domain-containing protein n=1 Tax=Fopius arisanus TaxID=64838 RepID=A0A9R1UAF6_9HYME|nr:PREDICTED: uncharacterized protein LOC105272916 [Fopius arisanus]
MTDFEAAEINAIRHVFPHVRLRCCWFHYNQAVTARWYHLDLDEAPQIILFFAWQLALAPSTRYEEGLRIIAKRIALHEDEFPKLHLFHNYLLTQWLPKACLLSVFEEDDRTNNPAEACNRHLTKELGGCKPPLWTLLYNLDKYIKVTNNKLTRVLANVKISKSYQTKRQREDNERIERCQAKLSSGEYDLDKFLFESINKQRQQEIFEEIKFLQKDNSGVGSRNLAATDILLDVENAIQDPPNVSMSLLPSSRLRPQKIEKTKKATSSDTLQQMTVQEANQRVQNLANKKMEGYVQLEGEEYGSKKRRKWKSKRAGTRGCYTDQPNLKNKNIGFRSTKNTKKKSSETIKVMQPLQNSSKASVEFEENFHGVSRSFAPANVMKEAIPEENEKGNFNDDGDFTDIEFLDEKLLQEMDGN